MRRQAVTRTGTVQESDRLGDLALQITRLLRHRSYARHLVVSAMLLRFLPDGLRSWNGPDDIRKRLAAAALDRRSLDHLFDNVATELAMAHAR